MNKTEIHKEKIELTLPANPAFVSAARLTASSIANRLGFDIDEIEDIKAAVSEACTFFIKKTAHKPGMQFKVLFYLEKDCLETQMTATFDLYQESTLEDMSFIMIKALMDSSLLEISEESIVKLVMIKKHKQMVFNEV